MENDGTWREKQRNTERRVTLLYVVKQGAPPSKLLFCLIFCRSATLSATLGQHCVTDLVILRAYNDV